MTMTTTFSAKPGTILETPTVVHFGESVPFIQSAHRVISLLFNNITNCPAFVQCDNIFIIYKNRAVTMLIRYASDIVALTLYYVGTYNKFHDNHTGVYLPYHIKITKELLLYICDIFDKFSLEEFDYNPLINYNCNDAGFQKGNAYQINGLEGGDCEFQIKHIYNDSYVAILDGDNLHL